MKSEKYAEWSRLDNAAKIFPPTSSERDPKVFRFSCELYEDVDNKILQKALDKTMEQFPLYRSILEKGMFWYYFEATALRPKVKEEHEPPCSPIYNGDRKDLLFRVSYYRRRINLEIFHALADGTGALHFLRVLVYHYITICHADVFQGQLPAIDYDASQAQQGRDSFQKYFSRDNLPKQPVDPAAYRIHGGRFVESRIGVIEGVMPVKELLTLARSHETSITALFAAIMICSIHEEMTLQEERRPVVITVPVNLRNYFPSESARNFFGLINVGYDFKHGDGQLDEVIRTINKQFQEELTAQRLKIRMNRLSALEHRLLMKVVPLALKDPVMRFAGWVSDFSVTAALSNIGKIQMPPELAPYIRLFDVFTSTSRLQACMCSYQDRFVVSFTSPFVSADIQRRFFRTLTGFGIPVEITTNLTSDGTREEETDEVL